jgi:hypothetical protein
MRAPKQVSQAGSDQDLLGILLVLDSLGEDFIMDILTLRKGSVKDKTDKI